MVSNIQYLWLTKDVKSVRIIAVASVSLVQKAVLSNKVAASQMAQVHSVVANRMARQIMPMTYFLSSLRMILTRWRQKTLLAANVAMNKKLYAAI